MQILFCNKKALKGHEFSVDWELLCPGYKAEPKMAQENIHKCSAHLIFSTGLSDDVFYTL